MKKNIFSTIILLGLIAVSYSQTKYKSAIVSFYNFENLYDTIFHGKNDDPEFTPQGSKAYTSAVYHDKLLHLATVLSQIGTNINPDGPAILGTAEIENQYVLDTLLRHPLIANRNYKYVHYDSRDARGVDVALIYNPKYFRVVSSKPLYVQLPVGAKDAFYTRDVLWVTGYLDGEKLHVFVNHWPSRSGGEKKSEPGRMAAAKTVRTMIDSILNKEPNSNIIVMGDLNDDPINNSVTKGLKASGSIKKIQEGELYNPWVEHYKKGLGTLAYQDAWSLFDQIIISQSFLNKEKQGFFFYKNAVFNPDYIVENIGKYKGYPMRTYSGDTYRGGYSDHFPTYIVLLKKAE